MLKAWEDFYVIVGSSAGALIGLQFVVMTLIADVPTGPGGAQAASAFGTPTVVHFAGALLLAALLTVPWSGVGAAAVAWGLTGLGGLVYMALVIHKMRRQSGYRPEFEDWLFHALAPVVAYALLAVSALLAGRMGAASLDAVAAAALLLLFTGIHNAWDTVIYHVFTQRARLRRPPEREPE